MDDILKRKFVCDMYSSWAQGTSLYMKWAADHGINYYELLVFYVLDMKGSMTQKAICDYYGLPKQTINSVIRNLKKDDYLILKTSEKDKREKMVVLTEKGTEYAKKNLSSLYSLEERICKNIGRKRFFQMIETAELFNLLFEKEMERKKQDESV